MLVTFSSRYYANITYFGDVAVQLLHIMGHSGRVPGAMQKEEVEAARDKLAYFINNSGNNLMDNTSEDYVSLRNRALPLLDLFNAAVNNQEGVYWE